MKITLPLPTPRLVAVIVGLAPLWLIPVGIGGVPLAAVALLLLAVAVAADALTLPASWQVVAERQVAGEIGLGDWSGAVIRLRSRAGRQLLVALYDALPAGLTSDAPRGSWLALEAHGVREIPFRIVGHQRGAFRLGPIVLRVQARLGLVQRTIREDTGDTVAVTPSFAGVRQYRLLTLQHRLRDAGVRAIRRRGDGTNFANLREYVVGDDPRRIDWKATARRDKLIAREFTIEQGQTVMIVIDAGRMMTQIAGDRPRIEYALSAATLLADVAAQSGDQVGAMVFDDAVRVFTPPTRGRQVLQRLRAALIPVRATMAEPDYATAFRTLAARQRKRSLIVLFTDVVDRRASQALLAHTARSAMRHLLLVVALRNDQLVGATIPPAGATADQVFASAAAEELVLGREEALAQMRRSGVSVLDVSPQVMTAAVVNRYLEIKARAWL